MTGNVTQIGWYCWRCRQIRAQPCRSDNPPIYVDPEWVEPMVEEIQELEE